MSNDLNEPDALGCIVKHNHIDGQIVNPTCKLCCSPFRKEVEAMAETHGKNINYGSLKSFLDSKGETIALANVKNHILKHHFGIQEKITLEEYRQSLIELSKNRQNRFETLEQIKDIATLELTRCVVIQSNGDVSIEKERQRMMQDNNKLILQCVQELNSMEDGNKKVLAVYERVVKAFNIAREEMKTDLEKKVFDQVYEAFKKTHQSMKDTDLGG